VTATAPASTRQAKARSISVTVLLIKDLTSMRARLERTRQTLKMRGRQPTVCCGCVRHPLLGRWEFTGATERTPAPKRLLACCQLANTRLDLRAALAGLPAATVHHSGTILIHGAVQRRVRGRKALIRSVARELAQCTSGKRQTQE
jgi:hypothetical protein